MLDDRTRLLITVRDLRAQLDSAHGIDPQVAASMRATIADLEARLAEGEGAREGERETSLKKKLTDAAVDFETSHPTLAGAITSVIDALGGIGI